MRRGVFDNQCQFCLIWASLFPAFLTSFLQKERRESSINNTFYNLIKELVILPLASSFSCKAALISMMPVFLMNSGRSNGGFSIPRLPCK